MKLIATTMLFMLTNITLAHAGDLLWCRGTAFIPQVGFEMNLSLTFSSTSHEISIYDISDDTESWWPMKEIDNQNAGNHDHIKLALDSEQAPDQIKASDYEVEYEVDQKLGFPSMLYDFHGTIGGLTVPKTDLTCKFE